MRIELPSGTPAEAAGDGATRGLVVVPDIMGLRPLFDAMVARLAREWGCRVVAPEPFPGQEQLPLEERFGAITELEDDRVLGDMVAAADATGAPDVCAIGFCMGGMYAFKAASTGRFRRIVPFYGMIRIPENMQGPGHREPLDHLAEGDAASVMAVIGTIDPYTPPADVEAIEAAGVTIAAYDGAEHGFVHDPDRPAHRADDAADAWRRTEAWLWG